ncbi:MAG TPA: BON domain-containing protein [Chloroflexota bacterium]
MPARDAMQTSVRANLQQRVGDLAKYIEAAVDGNTVTLAGAVETWDERDAIMEAAQNTLA